MNWKKLSFGNFSPVINPQRTGHGLLRYLCALYRLKLSRKSLRLTALNIGYTIKLGSSAFVSEASIASMMFLGNYLFIRHLGEDGVAAFSIVCYFFPIIFMVYNTIAQSAQPIISYNFGADRRGQVLKAFRLSAQTALLCGAVFSVITVLCRHQIVSLLACM